MGRMHVVHAVASERAGGPEPGVIARVAGWLLASVLGPFDVGRLAQDAGLDERADVHADAVVQVGVPADGLLVERFPAHEDVVRRLAGEDQLELVLQRLRGGQPQVRAGARGPALGGDPIAEIRIGQILERLVVELVVIDQGREPVLAPVPDVPEKRALVESFAVLVEKEVAEPFVEGCAGLAAGGCNPPTARGPPESSRKTCS